MGVGKQITPAQDLTTTFNTVYQINRDVSSWDKLTIQVVAPILGTAVYVYGSIDSGYQQQTTQGNASLAINYTPIQVVNLATGVAANTITAAGLYRVTANDQQFVRIQGNPAGTPTNVYRILMWESKVD
jgi:hypothetical protein